MFEKQIAIVTGGESGIGAACAKALGDAGACVVITYFKDQAAAEAVCASKPRSSNSTPPPKPRSAR